MARRGGASEAMQWGLAALGSYMFYQFSVQGKFGKDIQTQMLNLRNTLLKGFGKTAGAAPATSGGALPGGTSGGTSGGDRGFIAGTRYVASDATGPYLYWYGAVTRYPTQSAAELAYNAHFVAQFG